MPFKQDPQTALLIWLTKHVIRMLMSRQWSFEYDLKEVDNLLKEVNN